MWNGLAHKTIMTVVQTVHLTVHPSCLISLLSMSVHAIGSVRHNFVLHSFVLVVHDHKCQNLSFSFVVQGGPA